MNNLDYIELFCSHDTYPKMLILSDHHFFLGIGISDKSVDLSQEDHFYVYSRSFYKEKTSSFWDPFLSESLYLPDLVYLDGKQYNYSKKSFLKKPIHQKRPNIHFIKHGISYEDWDALIHLAKNSGLEKIVLARQSFFSAEEEVDPFYLLEKLSHLKGSLFAYQIDPDHLFFGLSPEHLFIRKDSQLLTEALAGTRKRGLTIQEDTLLEEDLLSTQKDLNEFLFVSDYIRDELNDIALSVKVSDIKIKKNQAVQHLNQSFDVLLKKAYSDTYLIEKLHPTPAVCGFPKQETMSWIKQHEIFDRGLYAAPIGWINKYQSEILVGIRSCLMKKQDLCLIAGVGVVENSDSALEWQELNHKLRWIENIFYEQDSKIQPLLV